MGRKNLNEEEKVQLLQDISSLIKEEVFSKEQIKQLKEAAFGPTKFWVTETIPIREISKSGLLIRGNLRADRGEVFARLCEKVEDMFPGKYEVLLIEDLEAELSSSTPSPGRQRGTADRGPAIAFQIVPVAELPPGLDTWDPSSYVESAVPIITALLVINISHELGHRLAAAFTGVKLGPSFFIPSFQVGTFGAITPFRSLVKDRAAMWDVAAAGPLAGFLASLSLLILGLLASDPSQFPRELLVPVPRELFNESLLLGTIAQVSLGEAAMEGSKIYVSPLALAGWYGLIITALNTLPVGCLDGGRMVQGAFGKGLLPMTSFFTYLGLGLGLIGNTLSLPFGLYVVLCQRTAEKYIKDNVAPAGKGRQTATIIAVLAAILVLVPVPTMMNPFSMDPMNQPFL